MQVFHLPIRSSGCIMPILIGCGGFGTTVLRAIIKTLSSPDKFHRGLIPKPIREILFHWGINMCNGKIQPQQPISVVRE